MYLDSGITINKDSFIVNANDNSKKVTTELKSNIDLKKVGTQKITIEAKEPSGNVTTKTASLVIKKDTIPPVIYGVNDKVVNKHTKINYLSGVSSIDNVDGKCDIEVDDSRVNVDKAGVYSATYI